MTIASQASRISYVGDGVTTAFAVPFYFAANADIMVMLQDSSGVQSTLVLGTGYSLSGAGISSGGTCTFTTAPTATTGAVISIYRDPQVTQTTSYNNNDPFPAKSHEAALDKLTTLEQRTRDMISRSLQLRDSDAAVDMHLPANRQGKILGFDSSNNPIAVLGPSFVTNTYSGAAVVESRAVAAVTTFGSTVNYILTGGLITAGDGGDAVYIRGAGTGGFTDGGGVSWKPASTGSVLVESRAAAALKTFSPIVNYIVTGGLVTAGDGLGDVYIRGSGDGGFTDAGGTSWKPVNASPNPSSAQASSVGQIPAAIPKAATVTVSIASPDVVTWTGHTQVANTPVVFSTTGALPTGITAGTTYYIIGSSITANTFKLATSVANAMAGTAINTSGSQSGVHTAVANLNASSGNMHEYLQVDVPSASFVTITPSGSTFNIASISLPVGRWLVWGNVVYSAQAATDYSEVHVSISTTSGTLDAPSPASSHALHVNFITAQSAIIPTANKYLTITTTTTVYLTAACTWTTAAMRAYGSIFVLRL